ncbi:uncharacterized protein [Periplaneta americana]|uniref:uncharacterized protein isoform X2 n=1 Tax=Periplaneta americana TaxID=6978 RepID=UPI0037E83215
MDLIKKEYEFGLSTTQTSDYVEKQEKPLAEEGNFFSPYMTEMKGDFMELRYDFTSEVKIENTSMAVESSAVKCEAEEGNILNLQVPCTTGESTDPSYAVTWEVKCEDTPVPVSFPKEEPCVVESGNEQLREAVDEDEVLSDSKIYEKKVEEFTSLIFLKECRKVGKPHSGDGAYEITTSTWRLFDQLKFLKNTTALLHRDSSLLADSDTCSTAHEATMSCKGKVQSSPLSLHSHSAMTALPQRKKTRSTRSSTSKRNEQLLEIEKRKIEILQKESEKECNDDYHFFESLLPYMAHIPLIRKLKLRCRIQDLILNELESLQSDIPQHLAHLQSWQNDILLPHPQLRSLQFYPQSTT